MFEVQVVEPLRQLRNEGHIAIEEVSAAAPGQYRVVHVLLRVSIVSSDPTPLELHSALETSRGSMTCQLFAILWWDWLHT